MSEEWVVMVTVEGHMRRGWKPEREGWLPVAIR
jgi:hypothetical protein